MALFGECAACPTKDQHIDFLQDQVRSLQKQLVELTSPGANARIAWQPSVREKKEPALPPTHSPRELANRRRDLPTPESEGTPTPPAVVNRNIEDDFARGNA